MTDLDSMLTPAQAAQWLSMKPRELAAKSRGSRPKIPVFPIGQRTLRYHPRTIIAKLAQDAGVSVETIAASFGVKEKIQ